jgi:hypothetical protein
MASDEVLYGPVLVPCQLAVRSASRAWLGPMRWAGSSSMACRITMSPTSAQQASRPSFTARPPVGQGDRGPEKQAGQVGGCSGFPTVITGTFFFNGGPPWLSWLDPRDLPSGGASDGGPPSTSTTRGTTSLAAAVVRLSSANSPTSRPFGRQGLNMEQAFSALRTHARNHKLRLVDVGETVISGTLALRGLDWLPRGGPNHDEMPT